MERLYSEPTWFRIFWITVGKRALDIMLSSIGIILCAPLWVIFGIAIRIDSPGPVFYCQERIGKDGKLFRLFKLRTMYDRAEIETGPVWAENNDPRITKPGRLLRRWHLDETPQFINVLLGSMSIVGPRPERKNIHNALVKNIPDCDVRLQVKPGITGLSQVKQGYDNCIRDFQKKVRYDRIYIKRMCAYLDFKILYLTAVWIILQKGR